MAPVVGHLQQLAHDARRRRQCLDRLEQWRHVERYLRRMLVDHLGPAREQQHGEYVVRIAGAADDIVADRVGTVAMPAVNQGVEYREGAPTHGIKDVRRADVPGQCIDQPPGPIFREA